ncbi:MAG: hypothetical protein RLO50_11035 [Azospirillaceae bacterium]
MVLSALRRQPGDRAQVEERMAAWSHPAAVAPLAEAADFAARALVRLSPVWLEGLTGHPASLGRAELLVLAALSARQRRIAPVRHQALTMLAATGYAELLGKPLDAFADLLALHDRMVPASPAGGQEGASAATAGRSLAGEAPAGHPSIADLTRGERLIIEGARYVVHCWRRQQPALPTLDQAFRDHGLIDCAAPLDRLIATLGAAASRSIDIRCRACAFHSVDEARITRAVAHRQRANVAGAQALLSDLLPPAACRLAVQQLAGLAIGLMRGQAILPLRPLPVLPETWEEAPAANPSRAASTLH